MKKYVSPQMYDVSSSQFGDSIWYEYDWVVSQHGAVAAVVVVAVIFAVVADGKEKDS